MPSVNRSALISYSADKMYDLVNDVLSYPQFLTGCADTSVLESDDHNMVASVMISTAGIKQWFTTKNELKRGAYIRMDLVDGPFRSLTGGWTFTALTEDACKIELDLEFEFSSKIVEMAFGKAFNIIAANMVKAFTDRAKEVYSV